jgi:hypothetical protein
VSMEHLVAEASQGQFPPPLSMRTVASERTAYRA